MAGAEDRSGFILQCAELAGAALDMVVVIDAF